MKSESIQELFQIIDRTIPRKIFFDLCLCKNILHDRDCADFVSLLYENGLIDGGEVLKDFDSFFRKFHMFP